MAVLSQADVNTEDCTVYYFPYSITEAPTHGTLVSFEEWFTDSGDVLGCGPGPWPQEVFYYTWTDATSGLTTDTFQIDDEFDDLYIDYTVNLSNTQGNKQLGNCSVGEHSAATRSAWEQAMFLSK